MSSRSFFFSPPFRYLATHLVTQDEDFKVDAHFILGIDEAAFDRVAKQLEESGDFLDRAQIEAIANPILGADSAHFTDFLTRISGALHSAEIELSAAMNEFAEIIREKLESFSGPDRESLVQRIRRLAVVPTGVAKQHKARQLAEAIGCELESFRIICDIRPVFDQMVRMTGAIPITMMRLEYSTPNGDNEVTEVRVTEKQVAELSKKLTDAQTKLNMIRKFMSSHNVTIPKTKATISEV